MFKHRTAYTKKNYPFESEFNPKSHKYPKGICPVSEELYEQKLLFGKFVYWPLTELHIDEVVAAFKKVLAHRDALIDYPSSK